MDELKFAVVREDPEIEIEVARRLGARRVLLVASGGCTAFAMAHALPDVKLSLYDANPHQLAHVERKADAIAAGELAALNVDDDRREGLSQCGAFERLFEVMREAMGALVADADEREAYFAGDRSRARAWMTHRYWPAVFEATFTETLLVAMFGPDAVQHATPGSYPAYFRRRFELGLARSDGPSNPFLQHVLLGRYLGRDAFPHLRARRRFDFDVTHGELPDVAGLDRFDLVHLSNIFDWSTDATVARWGRALHALRPGAAVTIRQLNNQRALADFLDGFAVDEALGEGLLARDRSLFYERVTVAVRR
ncbi:MAG: DUF3419 family protein [Myxococcales bacterium]|nr:DUF3419 family protein [Myxococcales bacterium]